VFHAARWSCGWSVGGLLLIFGLQWLWKVSLRASGPKTLLDEDAIYGT
jgi:uncharacterized membrane protein